MDGLPPEPPSLPPHTHTEMGIKPAIQAHASDFLVHLLTLTAELHQPGSLNLFLSPTRVVSVCIGFSTYKIISSARGDE